jgi:hypothetical protein
MVMQERKRSLTVEEIKNLPPPTPEAQARRRAALEDIRVHREEMASRWGGPLSEQEFLSLLFGPGEADCLENSNE